MLMEIFMEDLLKWYEWSWIAVNVNGGRFIDDFLLNDIDDSFEWWKYDGSLMDRWLIVDE